MISYASQEKELGLKKMNLIAAMLPGYNYVTRVIW